MLAHSLLHSILLLELKNEHWKSVKACGAHSRLLIVIVLSNCRVLPYIPLAQEHPWTLKSICTLGKLQSSRRWDIWTQIHECQHRSHASYSLIRTHAQCAVVRESDECQHEWRQMPHMSVRNRCMLSFNSMLDLKLQLHCIINDQRNSEATLP